MNRTQRIVLFSIAFILFVMLLFPPFYSQFPVPPANNSFRSENPVHGRVVIILNQGYSFLFSPPYFIGDMKAPVNILLLLVQTLVVISIGGILFLALKSK